ncbi:MAG: hypothetical protein R3E31_25735 [Chloroflexota bacterium]
METEDVGHVISGPGDVFGWSALLPPYQATAAARALCHAVSGAFDGPKLDANGYSMIMNLDI